MTKCGVCRARAELFLCERHVGLLEDLLADLGWLLRELDVTRCRQDRLTIGSTRRSAETLNPINVGAAELAREAASVLRWIQTTAGALDAAAIARSRHAGEMYESLTDLAGDPDFPDSRPGRITVCIDRTVRVFGGLCPTLVGRDARGEPVECGTALYNTNGARLTTCPGCSYEIDTERNRSRCMTDEDLCTETSLLALLEKTGEPVPLTTFRRWVTQGKITCQGWMHDGVVVPKKLRYHDSRVFSLSAVRAMRAGEMGLSKSSV